MIGCTPGPWIDVTVQPAPNQRINIHATVRELERAPRPGRMPLVVITAGILKDRWLKTVPELEAKPQARLAGLSADSIHVLDRGIGHLIPTLDPQIVIAATQAVLWAAASGHAPEQGARQGALAASCAIATVALLLGVLTSVTIALFPHHVPLRPYRR